MAFKLSKRSWNRLSGVNPNLVGCVKYAIAVTKVDFGVTCGTRTMDEQRKLVKAGKSHTMKSKHLTGDAVDLVAYVRGSVAWEVNLYDEIADAMQEAATMVGCSMRWGGAWHINDIRDFDGTMEEAMIEYIDLRRSQGRRPFIDGPHFELT